MMGYAARFLYCWPLEALQPWEWTLLRFPLSHERCSGRADGFTDGHVVVCECVCHWRRE